MRDDQVGWIRDLDELDAALVRAFRNAAVALGHGSGEHEARTRADLAVIAPRRWRASSLRSFWALMSTIGTQATRQVRFHVPECTCLGEDEAVFLQIFAHLRAGERADALARANRLVPTRAAERVVDHAELIATRCMPPLPRGVAVRDASPWHRPAGTRLH